MYIEMRRPFSLVLILGVVFVSLSSLTSQTASLLDGQGGDEPPQIAIHTAEDEVRRARLESQIAENHIEILKYQLRRLEQEREIMRGDLSEEQDDQFRAALRELLDLIEGKRRADEKMVLYFGEFLDARRSAMAFTALSTDDPRIIIEWPVLPEYGISAVFDDKEYERVFRRKHESIDIPAIEQTSVVAAADGRVKEAVDNGLGFNYVTISHDDEYVTLYGHLSTFSVEPGQYVRAGDELGKSGGMPGKPGAGNSTGPHLHFQVLTAAGPVNPLLYLPAAGVKLRL